MNTEPEPFWLPTEFEPVPTRLSVVQCAACGVALKGGDEGHSWRSLYDVRYKICCKCGMAACGSTTKLDLLSERIAEGIKYFNVRINRF